ncbi:hypothetical protein OG21DRAFT_1491881 [Imleria badia]|nr:hypothetical protein OG21DRAFT_1491881 [Imleria badia]
MPAQRDENLLANTKPVNSMRTPGQMHTQPASSNGLKRKHMENLPASTKSPNTTHAPGQMPTMPVSLKHKKAYFDIQDASPPKKWTRGWKPSPYPTKGQLIGAKLEDLCIKDNNPTVQGDTNVTGEDNDCMKQSKTSGAIANTEGAVVNANGAVANTNGKKYVKAKASDYDRGTRSVIETAIEFYCVTLLCNNPYAQPVKKMDWARVAWDKAHLHHQVTIPHDIVILKLITACTSHLWGQFKANAHAVVMAVYGFDSSTDDNAIQNNQALFLELKQDSVFIFQVRDFCPARPCSQMQVVPWQYTQ